MIRDAANIGMIVHKPRTVPTLYFYMCLRKLNNGTHNPRKYIHDYYKENKNSCFPIFCFSSLE